MSITRHPRRIAACLIVLLCSAGQAAVQPHLTAAASSASQNEACPQHRHIHRWENLDQLGEEGFHIDLIGAPQASLAIQGQLPASYLAFDLAANPSTAAPVASRITEIESGNPIDERVKCWDSTPTRDIVSEYVVRFDQPATLPGLTENLLLWNSPLPAQGNPEPPHLMTAVGVTRSLNSPYSAVVAQDLNTMNFQGLFLRQPIPAWLDATQWHGVRVTISDTHARIQVAQGSHPYTTVLEVTLPHPVDALAQEFSLDNDNFPFPHSPVFVPDGLDLDCVDIRTVPNVLYDQDGLSACGVR